MMKKKLEKYEKHKIKSNKSFMIDFIGLFFIFIGVYCLIYYLSSNVVLISDDWHFKFVFKWFWPKESDKRIEGIGDIISSMNNFYYLSGGRIMAHTLLQIILMADKVLFNIINPLIFILVGVLIYEIVKIDRKYRTYYFAIIFILMIFFIPSFGDSCIWVSGSVNYLWISLIYLLLFVCDKYKFSTGKYIFAFLAGFTNEPIGGMIVVFFISRTIVTRKKIGKNDIMCCILAIIGTAFIVLAPGNNIRASTVNTTNTFDLNVIWGCLVETFYWLLSEGYWLFLLVPIIVLIVCKKHFAEFQNEIAFCLSGFAGIFALTFSGVFIVRAEYPCVLFLIISFVGFCSKCLYYCHENECCLARLLNGQIGRIGRKICILILILLLSIDCIGNLKIFNDVAEIENRQMEKIIKASETGENLHIQLKNYSNTGRFYPQEVSVSNAYEASWRGKYYGIEVTWKD